MTLRLDDSETEALRRRAPGEGRSMQEGATWAFNRYTHDADVEFRALSTSATSRWTTQKRSCLRSLPSTSHGKTSRPSSTRAPAS